MNKQFNEDASQSTSMYYTSYQVQPSAIQIANIVKNFLNMTCAMTEAVT